MLMPMWVMLGAFFIYRFYVIKNNKDSQDMVLKFNNVQIDKEGAVKFGRKNFKSANGYIEYMKMKYLFLGIDILLYSLTMLGSKFSSVPVFKAYPFFIFITALFITNIFIYKVTKDS